MIKKNFLKLLIFAMLIINTNCTSYGEIKYNSINPLSEMNDWEVELLGISEGSKIDGTWHGDHFLWIHLKIKNNSNKYRKFSFSSKLTEYNLNFNLNCCASDVKKAIEKDSSVFDSDWYFRENKILLFLKVNNPDLSMSRVFLCDEIGNQIGPKVPYVVPAELNFKYFVRGIYLGDQSASPWFAPKESHLLKLKFAVPESAIPNRLYLNGMFDYDISKIKKEPNL